MKDLRGLEPDDERDAKYQRVLKDFWSTLKSAGKRFPGARQARLLWRCMRDPAEDWHRRALACSALLYFVLVIDLVPDPLPGGWVDDLVIMVLMVSVLSLEDALKGEKR